MKLNVKVKAVLSITIIIMLAVSSYGFAYAEESLKVEAKSAILIDASTGKVILEQNSHEKLPPASVTKIMVLLLTMEALESNKISLEDQVVVSSRASGMGGSQVYLEEGETQTVESLIRAICLRSANDASVALGEYIEGSEELFIEKMNTRARELGMKNTNFNNTSGLPDDNHYTTAYDISLMSRELLKHSKIHEWLTIWMSDILVGKEKDITQTLVNTNRLIRNYPGANGIKTGYTSDAKYCLSGSATRGNLTLIAVILGSDTSDIRFREVAKLLDYGFANYDSLPITNKGDVIKRIPVHKGKTNEINILVEEKLNVLVKKGSSENVDKEIILPDYIDAPIKKGDKVGEMIIKIEGKEVGRVNLIINEEIEKANLLDMINKIFKNLLVVR